MVYLGSTEFKKFYHANLGTLSTFITVLVWLMIIAFPFAIAFKTTEFGLRQYAYLDEPVIEFRDEVIIYNLAGTTSSGYSSVDTLNSLFENKISSAAVSTLRIDNNRDGKTDLFQFKISFTGDSTTLRQTQIYLFFNYVLTGRNNVQLQDFVKIQLTSASGIEKAKVVGRIELDQRAELEASTITNAEYNTSPFSSTSSNLNIADFEKQKASRDLALFCDCEAISFPALGTGKTEIDIELVVPATQLINYKRRILENLKFSWIEYASIFIPLYIILTRFLSYIFKARIFPTIQTNDLAS